MASDAMKIARLQCSTQLTSQMLGIVTDPLWSTILGFCAVHKLRKEDLVGPIADDILYAGIIAINAARTPGLQDLAGKGIDTVGMLGAGATGLLAGKVLAGAGAAAGTAAVTATKATWLTRLFTAGSALGLGVGATAQLFGGVKKLPAPDTPALRAKHPGYFEYHDEYGKWPNNAQLKAYKKERGY